MSQYSGGHIQPICNHRPTHLIVGECQRQSNSYISACNGANGRLIAPPVDLHRHRHCRRAAADPAETPDPAEHRC